LKGVAFKTAHATGGERRLNLPGDRFVAVGMGVVTDAVTSVAAMEAVWPRLLPMGTDRAGCLSDDRTGHDGMPSTTKIIPAIDTPRNLPR
jgi:hypothetical protein